MTTTISLRVDEEKAEKLESLAKATDRSRSWLLEQALDAYLEVQAWQVEQIEKGMAELRADEGVSHERVSEWLRSWGTDDEKPAPS
jgi:predicted transcriptional regulator